MEIPQSITGFKKISLYKGNYYPFEINCGDIYDIIEAVYFVCSDLGVKVSLEKDGENNSYFYNFTAEETSEWTAGEYTYGVTVVFSGYKPVTQDGMSLFVNEAKNGIEEEVEG